MAHCVWQWKGEWGLPGGPVAETLQLSCGGPGSVPGQGTRSHMPQLRVHTLQLKISHTMKTEDLMSRSWGAVQPNKYILDRERERERSGGSGLLAWDLEWATNCATKPSCFNNKTEILGLTEKIIWDKMLRAMYGTQQIPTDVNYYAPAITKQNEIRNPFAKKN